MTIKISVDILFFAIPVFIVFIFAQKISDVRSWGGSERDWFYMLFIPLALFVGSLSWGIYLKWFD